MVKRETCTSWYTGALRGPWGFVRLLLWCLSGGLRRPSWALTDIVLSVTEPAKQAPRARPQPLGTPVRHAGIRVPMTVTQARTQKMQAGPGQSPQGLVVSARGTRDKPTINTGQQRSLPFHTWHCRLAC